MALCRYVQQAGESAEDGVGDPGKMDDFNEEYHVIELLGSGNYSSVFLVKDSSNKGHAAKVIKLQKKSRAKREKLYRVTMNELRIIYALQGMDLKSGHDHIVKMKAWFVQPGNEIVLLFEKTGSDLFWRFFGMSRSLTEAETRPIIRQVFSAVAYMHEKQIMHCDIKMGNILCANERGLSPVKLSDFNASKYRGADQPPSPITYARGCHDIWDPQRSYSVVDENEKCQRYGRKGDIYSIGCVMFELLTQQFVFEDISSCGLEYCPAKDADDNEGRAMSLCEACMNVNLRIRTEKNFRANASRVRNRTGDCKEFIECLLAMREEGRPSADQALQHPWLQDPVNEVIGQRFLDLLQRPSWANVRLLFGLD